MNQRLLKQCAAEFIGTFAPVIVGVCAIYHNPGLLGVAFAHGLTIAVVVSATGVISGRHVNPAVTFRPAQPGNDWHNHSVTGLGHCLAVHLQA